jgi:sugar transferase (PEP-CTERM system associated)
LGVTEAVILFVSVYIGVMIGSFGSIPTDKLIVGGLWTKALLYTVVMVSCIAAMGLYFPSLRDDLRGVFFRLGLALLLGFLLISGTLAMVPSMSIGQGALAVVFASSAAGLALCHAFAFRIGKPDVLKRRVIVLGSGWAAKQIEQELRRRVDWLDAQLVGFVDVPGEECAVRGSDVLPKPDSLLELVLEHRIQELVVAVGDLRSNFPTEELIECKMSGIAVVDLATFLERQAGKVNLDTLKPSGIVFSNDFRGSGLKGRAHRLFDLVVAVLVLPMAAPIMLATAVAILIESSGRGSVLYKQIRVGREGKTFEIFKFRSMRERAEKSGEARWAMVDDPRTTRVGAFIRKTRIDELPQVLNVLKGEMSFVGPRPERPEFVEQLEKTIPYYRLRHSVNPGITGWAQIHYPYGASERDAREKLRYDLYYIKHFNSSLDIQILINTVAVVLWGRGAR